MLIPVMLVSVITASSVSPTATTSPLLELPRATVRNELEKPSYRFCHDSAYRLSTRDLDLCSVAATIARDCPQLSPACERARHQRDQELAARVDAARQAKPWMLTLSWLSRLLLWLVLAVCAAMVLFALRLVVLRLLNRASTKPHEADHPRVVGQPFAVATPQRRDSTECFAVAKTAARLGDWASAAAAAYDGLLYHLSEQGALTLHSSRTRGDYTRSLRQSPTLHVPFASATRAVDELDFGRRPATKEMFLRIASHVRAIAQDAILVSILVFGTLIASCTDLPFEDNDHRPSGFSLLRRLITEQVGGVHRRARSLERIEDDVGTLVVVAPLTTAEWTVAWDWLVTGKQLIVATAAPEMRTRLAAQIRSAATGSSCQVPVTLGGGNANDNDEQDKLNATAEAHMVALAGLSLDLEHEGFNTVDGCHADTPYFAWRTVERGGTLVMLPGSLPLSNAVLAAGDNAATMMQLFQPFGGTVELVGSWAGAGASSPLTSVINGRLGPAFLQALLLVLVLVGWRWRFGPARDGESTDRHAFVEHVRALGAHYARIHAARHVLCQYAVFALERLRRSLHLADDASREQLVQALVARTGYSLAWTTAVLTHAHEAISSPSPFANRATVQQDLVVLRALSQLLRRQGGTL